MPTAPRSGNDIAIGGLVLFTTLWFLWPIEDFLTSLVFFSAPNPALIDVIPCVLLIATATYLRAPSILWQIPLQALTLACLIVGLSTLIMGWRQISSASAGICVLYLATAGALGWLMRDLQRHFLSPHKPRQLPTRRLDSQ